MRVSGRIAIGFVIGLAGVIVLGVLTRSNTERQIEAQHLVNHTHEVIERLDVVLTSLLDAETGQRGFLLTGDERYLMPYNDARRRVDAALQSIAQMTRDNAAQQHNLDRLRGLAGAKLDELEETIAAERARGPMASLAIVTSGRGARLMAETRTVVSGIRDLERRLLDERTSEASASARWTTNTIVIASPLLVLALAASVLLITSGMTERLRRQTREIGEQNEELKQQSEELLQQSEEISQQSEELSRQNEELQAQSEEIQALNLELGRRENLLHGLLDAARLADTEETALSAVCAAARDMFGAAADAVVVFEREGDRLVVRASDGVGASLPDSSPAEHRFALLAIEQNRTASLNDVSLRPDLSVLSVPGQPAFQSVLAAPVRLDDRPCGAVAIYAREKQEWSTDHFRLSEWLAAQCAVILGVLRLQQDLRRQAALIDLSPDAVIVRETDGTILLWGHGAETLYGWSKHEAIGRTTHSLLRTRFPQSLEEVNATLMRTGRWSGELVHTTRDGREVIVESRWLAERNERGEITGLLESNIDITARRRDEETLRRNEEQLRMATTAAEIGVWSWTPGTSVVTVSANWRDLFGVPRDAPVTFETWAGALHPEDRERAVRELNEASAARRDFDTEYRVRRPDGTVRWLVDRGRAWYDDAGRPVGMAGINIDITRRKLAEQALRESDRRKSEFLATLSHELRNPLAPIRYALELLRCEGDDGSPAHPKRVIERQMGHLVRLVDDLLDVTRIASNKIRLRKARVDVAPIIQHAIEATAPDIEQASHSLIVSLPPEPLWIDGDPDRLAQVLTNLLHNAARYTPPGGRLTLTAAAVHDRVAVSVSDTGIGLRPEDRDRVFEMFTQVGEPGQGGLGIGLALVKGLVELHGGTVEARSKGPGQGSEFLIMLPRASAPAPGARSTPRARTTPGEGRRILVVDDNIDSADMLKTLLDLQGHEVRVANDGPAALEIIEDFAPDIGLFDIGLPGMSGYDLARRVRADARNDGLYLIAVTGWGQDEDRQRARDSGFNAHMTKPADPEHLQRLIVRASGSGAVGER